MSLPDNSPHKEDAGQRVIFSTSTNAVAWSRPLQLFPAVSAAGILAEPFAIIDGRLYAFASLGASFLDPKDDHNFLLARSVSVEDGATKLGQIFWASAAAVPAPYSTAFPHYTTQPEPLRTDVKKFLGSLLGEYVELHPPVSHLNDSMLSSAERESSVSMSCLIPGGVREAWGQELRFGQRALVVPAAGPHPTHGGAADQARGPPPLPSAQQGGQLLGEIRAEGVPGLLPSVVPRGFDVHAGRGGSRGHGADRCVPPDDRLLAWRAAAGTNQGV
jgi:hypothetical protein